EADQQCAECYVKRNSNASQKLRLRKHPAPRGRMASVSQRTDVFRFLAHRCIDCQKISSSLREPQCTVWLRDEMTLPSRDCRARGHPRENVVPESDQPDPSPAGPIPGVPACPRCGKPMQLVSSE